MQHHPVSAPEPLLPELRAELERVRAKRAFDPRTYLDAKTRMLMCYLAKHHLRAAVLGMSGGIDSAVVLGILRQTQRYYPATLQQIVPLALPTHTAAQGQTAATDRIAHLGKQWGIPIPICNLNAPHAAIAREMDSALSSSEPQPSDWALGQLTSYIRTPALYFATSLLTERGFPAFVAGTTNRDEGAYLGYVGKASDGMVDIQLIADLHKSEVRSLARHLGVTQEILDAVPSGEMHDGRVDEEVFGAPYDFVELFLATRAGHPTHREGLKWSQAAQDQYHTLAGNLESLHHYNAHKYLVGSPAVHLNVLESAVPGGWTK
jgi:NAD+ synthase (glutamine-hydrolysing)